MSPRLGAITERNPLAASAHTAASREEPQPKFSAATTIRAPRYGGWFRMKSGRSDPSALKRTSWNRKREYSGTLRSLRRKRAGMTRSVSTLGRSIGSPTAVSFVNGSTSGSERPHVGEPGGDRGGRGHRRRHQMSARALALAPLEVAIRRRRHALAGGRRLAVHPDAHRAAGFAPLEAGLAEDAVHHDVAERRARIEPHVGQCARHALAP